MRFGLAVPTCREASPYPLGFTSPRVLRDIAAAGERLGFHSLWANDHIASTAAQVAALAQAPNHYDPLVTFAFLAALTERIKLMTATIVTPLREPVLFAKQVAVLDQLSGGRLVVGMGIGSQREEFEALARNPKASRGAMQDEFVAALRMLLDEGGGSFSGRYFKFGDIAMAPRPLQRPFPLYLSGNVPDAIERVASIANGWIVSLVSPDEMREKVALLRGLASAAGRDPASIEVALFTQVSIAATEEAAQAAFDAAQPGRRGRGHVGGGNRLIGTPDGIAERLVAYRDAGVGHVGLVFLGRTPGEVVAGATLFAEKVMPRLA
ncbi:MAG TPA: TIGR03619 family F420-dependent LLM class oxidoreductase [Candidatus Limnocylindria bacterium]|nr:TIGR03619 family F420-dependent LLM class oxidoreductase [Candidatus Limnocylindria bacterium]